jgi:hypothetical protein
MTKAEREKGKRVNPDISTATGINRTWTSPHANSLAWAVLSMERALSLSESNEKTAPGFRGKGVCVCVCVCVCFIIIIIVVIDAGMSIDAASSTVCMSIYAPQVHLSTLRSDPGKPRIAGQYCRLQPLRRGRTGRLAVAPMCITTLRCTAAGLWATLEHLVPIYELSVETWPHSSLQTFISYSVHTFTHRQTHTLIFSVLVSVSHSFAAASCRRG